MRDYYTDEPIYSGTLQTKFGASLIIFCISLFAVSFPALSKRVKYLRIPTLVFFLGKHFGTGVILSTAFVHLLADAFKSLQSEWTGLIVLISLLAIFLVEYVSTAYVDYLQSYPSQPSSPIPSVTSNSRSQSLSSSHTAQKRTARLVHADVAKQRSPSGDGEQDARDDSEITPLTSSPSSMTITYGTHHIIEPPVAESEATAAFPQHSCPNASEMDVPTYALRTTSAEDRPGHECECRCSDLEIVPAELSKDDGIFGGGHHRHESREAHAAHTARSKKIAAVVLLKNPEEEEGLAGEQGPHSHVNHHHHHHHHHNGHGHAHLDIENCGSDGDEEEDELLHHDHSGHGHEGHVGHREEVIIGRRRQIVGILMLQIGIMLHSLVIGLTLAITAGPEFTTLLTAILFHQLFEGLSLGIRIAALPTDVAAVHGLSAKRIHLLKPMLATTFALTTPFGIGVGLLAFSGASRGTHDGDALMRMQGVMSAMSAGMLIYAACVEMLAGDFVMDPLMWRSGFGKQLMALVSLATGVCAMALVGMWD